MLFIVETSSAADINSLISENRLLESELQLAGKPDIYFIFNLEAGKIYFKTRGFFLKELPAEDTRLWGRLIEPKPLKLIKKSSFAKPGRNRIKPGKNDENSNSGIEALEVEDMPARYRLALEDGVSLYIMSKPKGFLRYIFYLFSTAGLHISRPVFVLWNTLRGRSFTEVDIHLSERNAKILYWSFPEGSKCIII